VKETTWKIWSRWENYMKTNLQEGRLGGEDWIAVVQDRNRWRALVNAIMNLRVP
jgi:hypothetical protein